MPTVPSTPPPIAVSGSIPRPAPPEGGRQRATVLVIVAAATITLLSLGVSWLLYRYQNTVIDNAQVKGRVHRIGARIDGQVRAVLARPGQRTRQGDLLLQLEDAHFLAALAEARSDLLSLSNRYEAERLAIDYERRRLQLDVERCQSVVRAAAAEVEASHSSEEKWNREYERIHALIRIGVASSSEMDRTTAERDNARALHKAATSQLEASQAICRSAQLEVDGLKVREARLSALAADVETGRNRVAVAEADLAATSIRAPEDGWVIDRVVEAGGSAKVGEPLITLWLGAPWIEAWADEEQLRDIRVGRPVDISLKAFPDAPLRGEVESIGVLTDREILGTVVPANLHAFFPRNAMVPIRVAIASPDPRVQPGLSALVGIRRGESPPTVSDPPQTAGIAAETDRRFAAALNASVSLDLPQP